MKSFFKKLSLVLAAAMVITMIPMQSAKAADVIIGERGEGNKVTPVSQVEVGYTAVWGFLGVTDYNTAASKTVKFTSSNKAVATVNGRTVTALSAGTTTISFSCTNSKGVAFAADSVLTVVAKGAKKAFTAKQTAYDTIVVEFASEDAAKAAKDNVKVELVKTTIAKGRFTLPTNAKVAQDKEKLTITNLNAQLTYCVSYNGTSQDVYMTLNKPAQVVMTYPITPVGKDTDICGDPNMNPSVTPVVEVVDAVGVVVARPTSNNLSFTADIDKSTDTAVLTSSTEGNVVFNAQDAYCTVKVVYSYTDNGEIKTLETTAVAQACAYTEPGLGDWVAAIGATTGVGKKAVYGGEKVTINVKDTYNLVYYFTGTDGNKYTGANVYNTVTKDVAKQLNTARYEYYFAKADESAAVLSLYQSANSAAIKGWTKGTERVYLYKAKTVGTQAPSTDEIVGYIDVTVNAEPAITSMTLDKYSISGYRDGYYHTAEVTATIKDQYSNTIEVAAANVSVKDKDTNEVVAGITASRSDKGKIKLTIDFAALPSFGTNVLYKTVNVCIANTTIKIPLTIYAQTVNQNSYQGYQVIADDKTVNDSTLRDVTEVAKIGVTLKVVKTFGGVAYQTVPFVLSSDDITKTSYADISKPIVVITDASRKIVAEDKQGTKIGTGASAISCTANGGFFFDAFKDNAGNVADNLKTGTFTANIYQITTASKVGAFSIKTGKTFTISNASKSIQSINPNFKIEKDGDNVKVTDKAIWTAAYKDSTTGAWVSGDEQTSFTADQITDNAGFATVLLGKLYGWYDKDGDGKVDDGEIDTISNLTSATVVGKDFITGADNKEVYVKTITIQYTTPAGVVVKQTITLNRKFKYGQALPQ